MGIAGQFPCYSYTCCDKVYVYLFSYQLQKRKELTKDEGIYSLKVDECTVAHIVVITAKHLNSTPKITQNNQNLIKII